MDAIEIYRHYIGANYCVGSKICSPLPSTVRKPDGNPSFSTKDIGTTIIWHDWGIESPYGYGPIGFVALMEGVDYEVARDIIKTKGFKAFSGYQKKNVFSSKPELIFNTSLLKAEHYQYYETLGVPPCLLHRYKIECINSIYKGLKPLWKETGENFGFYKKIGKGDKGYFPFNKAYSYLPKVLHQKIDKPEGWDELDFLCKQIIITKSLKDVIFLRSCGYNAISFSSETSTNILKLYWWLIKDYFEDIVVWGDPDASGDVLVRNVMKYIPNAKKAQSIIAKDPTDIFMETRNRFYINLIINRC